MTAPRPFTEEWAAGFHTTINASEAYRAAAQGWTWPVALVLNRDPELGYPEDVAVRVDLYDGACRSAATLPAHAADAPFVLRAGYATWKDVITGALDPIMAMMRQQIRLTGSLATIVRYHKAAKALVECARAVPTTFPDEQTGD